MYLGRIVERGPVEKVLRDPKHPCTRALLSAAPTIDAGRPIVRLPGELPSPGCHLQPRCPRAMPICRTRYPAQVQVGESKVACELYFGADNTAGSR